MAMRACAVQFLHFILLQRNVLHCATVNRSEKMSLRAGGTQKKVRALRYPLIRLLGHALHPLWNPKPQLKKLHSLKLYVPTFKIPASRAIPLFNDNVELGRHLYRVSKLFSMRVNSIFVTYPQACLYTSFVLLLENRSSTHNSLWRYSSTYNTL